MKASREGSRKNFSKRMAVVGLAVALLAAVVSAPAAQADRGQISAFGEYTHEISEAGGEGFALGGPIAVDPEDGNAVYAADFTHVPEPRQVRVRKYDDSGNLLGTALIDVEGQDQIGGIAVDGSEHRLYVLIRTPSKEGVEILAYSTVPDVGGQLPFATGVPSGVLCDFRTGGGAIQEVHGLVLDPSTHKLGVVGVNDPLAPNVTTLSYVTDAGVPAGQIDLTTGLVNYGPIRGVTIGPHGEVFLAVPTPTNEDPKVVTVFRLPRESETRTELLRIDDEPVYELDGFAAGSPIAVSPDGETLFIIQGEGEEPEAVLEFSTTTGRQRYLYGGGECETVAPVNLAGIAAGSGGTVASLGLSFPEFTTAKVVHVFGEGGTPCPLIPVADIAVEGGGGTTITKGETRTLSVGSGLLGLSVAKVEWDLDGDGTYETEVAGGSTTLTHKFTTVGSIDVGVRVTLENGEEVQPGSQAVQVSGTAPTPTFKASDKTPAPGETVSFDAGESRDPTGGPEGEPIKVGETGTYRWDFGDGQTLETHAPVVTHAFANPDTSPLTRTVKLVIKNHDGITSAAAAQTITVAGTQAPPPAEPAPTPTPTPTPTPAPAPTPAPKPLVCKKGFLKKQGKCVKAPAKKKHHKKHKAKS